MWKKDISVTIPRGQDVADRLTDAGIVFRLWEESGFSANPAYCTYRPYEFPAHKAILDPQFNQI
jgi:hypothetical protein